jgi:hypothetical protein
MAAPASTLTSGQQTGENREKVLLFSFKEKSQKAVQTTSVDIRLARSWSHGHTKLQGKLGNVVSKPGSHTPS